MYVLSVLSGLNAGANVELESFPVHIRGTLDDDENSIVLRDLGDASVTIALGKSGNLIITSKDLVIKLADGSPISDPKIGEAILAPVTLALSESVSIELTTTEPQTMAAFKIRRAFENLPVTVPDGVVDGIASRLGNVTIPQFENPAVPRMAALTLVVALLFLSLGELTTTVSRQTGGEVVSKQPETVGSEGKLPGFQSEKCPTCAAQAKLFLEKLLGANQIEGVTVTAEANVLKVRGEIVTYQKDVWRDVHKQYDLTWNATVPAEIEVTEIESSPPFEVRSVWLGDTPEFTTEEGAAFKIGDMTESGWRIDKIEKGAVTLGRSSAKLTIAF